MTDGEDRAGLWARLGARIYDPFLALGEHRGMARRRRALLADAEGRVLELGAGTGLNLPYYPAAVRELVLSEPEPAMRAALERRVARSDRPAQVMAAPAEDLPFAVNSFDTVVSTLVLCTVQDAAAALAEARRVIRPGGQLLFIEHVRAASARTARWQDRLAAPWFAFAQGCHCNLPTDALLAHELYVERLERTEWRGMPRIVRPLVVGAAQIRPSRVA